jgi:hypothetical protein
LSRIESIQDSAEPTLRERNNRIRSFTYDINDNLLTETWGSTLQQTYTYDNTSHLKTSYDATSNTTNTYTYNAVYQLTDTTTANTKFHYEYDIYGDLIQRQDWVNNSKIATLDYTYNNNHQLRHISQTGTGVIATEIDFSYDKLSQLQQIDRTSASDPTQVITQYRYTTAGLLEDINNYSQTTNTNTTTTNISHYHYTYDPGRLKLTTGTDGNKAVDYSNDNQINTVTTSTGSNEAYQFDTLGNRSTWSTDPLDSRRLLNDGTYKYLYDDEGNLTDKTEIATGKITTYQWDYRYVFNSPTNATDPSGEVFFIPFLIAAAEIAVTGALALGAINVVKQDLKIIEGSQERFKWGEFGSSLATGAVFNLAAATSPIAAAGLLAYGFVTGIQEGVQDWNAGHKLSGAFEIGTSLLALFGAKKFASEIRGLPENFKDAHKAWWQKSDGWANDAFNKDILPHKGNQNVNVNDKGQYKDSYTYELGGHKVDLRTSPIEIPVTAGTNGQFKAGKGINGKGNDPFWQVEFTWKQGEWNYNARWHSQRQGAPAGSGKPWAVTRRKEGTGGGKEFVETGRLKQNGEPELKKVKIPGTKAQEEIYLQYPDEWAAYKPYDRASKIDSKLRNSEDNKLLDRGHFRDNVRIFRNQKN